MRKESIGISEEDAIKFSEILNKQSEALKSERLKTSANLKRELQKVIDVLTTAGSSISRGTLAREGFLKAHDDFNRIVSDISAVDKPLKHRESLNTKEKNANSLLEKMRMIVKNLELTAGKGGAPYAAPEARTIAPSEESYSGEAKEANLKRLFDELRDIRSQMIVFLSLAGKNTDLAGEVGVFKGRINKAWDEIGKLFEGADKKTNIAKVDVSEISGKVGELKSESEALLKKILDSIEVAPATTMVKPEASVGHDIIVQPDKLNAEQKEKVEMLLDNPETVLDIVSKQFQGFRRLELFALRSNEAGYAEYEADTKKKIEELRSQVLQELEALCALEAGERSAAGAILLEDKIASLNAAFASAETFFGDEQKFPALGAERVPEDAESVEKRGIYIGKINTLRELHSTGLSRFYGTKWEKTKAFFGAEGPSPQKIVEQVAADHPLLKPGERLIKLSPQELTTRRKEFLKALRDKNFLSNEAESLYEAVLAKAEYQASLMGLGNSMMHSERQNSIKAIEKVFGSPFDQWPADAKEEFEQNLAVYKAKNVMDRVVIQEQQELLKAQAESLPPVEKGFIKRRLDWYRGLSKPKKLAVSVAFGLTITTAGGLVGIGAGIGTLGAAGSYTTSRLIRSSIAMPAMFLVGKGHDFVAKKLGFSEKAEQKKNEALEKLREEFSPENIAALQRAYGAIMEERAKTERRILKSKIALTAASGFLLAYGASHTDLGFGKIGEATGLSHGVENVGHEVIEMQPSHGLHGSHELYPSHGSDLTVEVHQGDNLWKILYQKLEAHGAFKGLSTQEQNHMIAMLEKEADNPEMMKAIGIRADIDLIYPDQRLNLAPLLEHSSVPGVAEHFHGHSGVHETLTHEAVPPKVSIEDNVVVPKGGSNVDLNEPGVVDIEHPLEHHGGHPPAEDHLPAENHASGADRTGVDHRFDSIEPGNFRGHFASPQSMSRLWILQHGGGHPPDSFMREAAEMRAHGILLKDTELFKSEVRFRMEDSLERIYGPSGINSPDWNYWNKYAASDILQMPDNQVGGPTAGNLRDYLRYLADNPRVEPPYTIGGRPETVEHFIARAEAVILDDELNAVGSNGFVPDNFSPRWYPGQGPRPSYYPQQHFYGGRGSNEHIWQRLRADHGSNEHIRERLWTDSGSNEHIRQRLEADQGSNEHIRERLWADSGSNEHIRQRMEADQGSNEHIRQRMEADNN